MIDKVCKEDLIEVNEKCIDEKGKLYISCVFLALSLIDCIAGFRALRHTIYIPHKEKHSCFEERSENQCSLTFLRRIVVLLKILYAGSFIVLSNINGDLHIQFESATIEGIIIIMV